MSNLLDALVVTVGVLVIAVVVAVLLSVAAGLVGLVVWLWTVIL